LNLNISAARPTYRLLNLANQELAQVEKLEGLALSGKGQILILNDNDFQAEVKGRFETQSNFFFLDAPKAQ
jgi:hypothetical protein